MRWALLAAALVVAGYAVQRAIAPREIGPNYDFLSGGGGKGRD